MNAQRTHLRLVSAMEDATLSALAKRSDAVRAAHGLLPDGSPAIATRRPPQSVADLAFQEGVAQVLAALDACRE